MPEIIKNYLNKGQYIEEKVDNKDWICLHYTVSLKAINDIDWWNNTPEKVATHYIIDRDGKIYETMPLETAWAYHLGAGIPENFVKRTVGIELVNVGGLIKKENNYYWAEGRNLYKGKENNIIKVTYAGIDYWEKYTEEQYEAINYLIKEIRKVYPNIGKQKKGNTLETKIIQHLNYIPNDIYANPCIFSHCNINKNKTDVGPAFDFSKIQA